MRSAGADRDQRPSSPGARTAPGPGCSATSATTSGRGGATPRSAEPARCSTSAGAAGPCGWAGPIPVRVRSADPRDRERRNAMIVVEVLAGVLGLGVVWVASGLRVVRQWERAVVFRFGKVQPDVRGPGLTRITPIRDRLRKVNMQIVTMPVPAQDGITRDNVTVRVDAVVYFRVHDPVTATRRRAELPVRRRAGGADVAAVDHRQERPRRPAVQPGEPQQGPGAAHRQPGAELGDPHRAGRDQGRGAAGDDEAVDVAAGRGGAGAAGARSSPRTGSTRRRGSCRRRRRS